MVNAMTSTPPSDSLSPSAQPEEKKRLSGLALVTGATGFVGASIVRQLLGEGFGVRAFVRTRSTLKNLEGLKLDIARGDLLDPRSVMPALKGVRYLFHAAADYRIWVPDEEALFRTNVEGTKTILKLAVAEGVKKIVYTSSVAAIPPRPDGGPADETCRYSSPGEAILKNKVREWLSQGYWLKRVIAYASAQSYDGGAGATYVLLRHRPLTKRSRKPGAGG